MKNASGKNVGTLTNQCPCLRLACRRGMTLLEIIVALAILGIIFAAVLPQFRIMFNSWDSKQASAEILQNGRILADHFNFQLARAIRITSVSAPADTQGYINFEDTQGNMQGYAYNTVSKYVEFGAAGNLSGLAGPVSQLHFTCYDACDLSTPITDVTRVRYVKATATFPNPSTLGQSRTFTTQAYLRTNCQSDDPNFGLCKEGEPWFEYDVLDGRTPALCQINGTHYLCAYQGKDSDGWAVVLQINPNLQTSKRQPFEFDHDKGMTPALAEIDDTHYLCVYRGKDDDGWAVVLEVNPFNYSISERAWFEFDSQDCRTPALAKMDSTHYLCAYEGKDGDGWAVVLEVHPFMWFISGGTPFEFDPQDGKTPALAQMDNTHYLCVYQGKDDDGWACVLTVNTWTGNISKNSSFEFDTQYGMNADLLRIDDSHFLCVYEGWSYLWSFVFTVNPATWAISKETPLQMGNSYYSQAALCWMHDNIYVCAYTNNSNRGYAVLLTVNEDWTVSEGEPVEFDSKGFDSALARIDDIHSICAYRGMQDDGWTGVLRTGAPVLP